MFESIPKLWPWLGSLPTWAKSLVTIIVLAVAALVLLDMWLPQHGVSIVKKSEQSANNLPPVAAPAKAGDVHIEGRNMAAGDGGLFAPGGDALIAGGDGIGGASGGDVRIIGPGTFKAGDAGPGGRGGNFTIKGGDAKK